MSMRFDHLGIIVKDIDEAASLYNKILGLTLWDKGVVEDADEMRSLFIRMVMGDYLKCFRCTGCGAKFITNKEPKYQLFGNGYCCPACHDWYAIKEDDSFLRTLVSEKQLNNTQHLEKALKEIEILEPFKAFLNVPCEICHKLIEEWDDYNVKLAIYGIGCGHTHCWNSEFGRRREFRKTIEKMKNSRELQTTGTTSRITAIPSNRISLNEEDRR